MDVVEITKNLIAIPSYVDSENNESKVAEWIFNYLKNNSPFLAERQFIGAKRFNVILNKCTNPDILICGHMDTVQPKSGWLTNPFKPVVKGNKVYGLGASDMKGSLAAILSAINRSSQAQNVMCLFYGDEEYDFLGMKAFIKKHKNKIRPKLIVSGDGSLKIGNTCRGLIELTVKVKGQSGHAADPKSGNNAILKSFLVITTLAKWLEKFSSPELGNSTINIAYISGGTNIGQKNNQVILGREGNIIPDYCEFVVEIRSANTLLNARLAREFLIERLQKNKLEIININTRQDLGSWITPQEQLDNILEFTPSQKVISAKKRGYADIQMLWENFGKVPCFTLGAGEKDVAHKENEYVKIASLKATEKFYRDLLTKQYGNTLAQTEEGVI